MVDDQTEAVECLDSSDGNHHLNWEINRGTVESATCVHCDHGRYYAGIDFDDLSMIDILALRKQARLDPEGNHKLLEEIAAELLKRGYEE